jgi:hypothetical protein
MENNINFFNKNWSESPLDLYRNEAEKGFEDAIRKQSRRKIAGLLTGRHYQLLDYRNVSRWIPFEGQHDAGIQQIPVEQVIGSVGRTQDFDAGYLPRKASLRQRWVKIARANLNSEYLPPIEVYQIGPVYFVQDGNHRVSVARFFNQATIEAHVVVIRVPSQLADRSDLEKATLAYEQEMFERQTGLQNIRLSAEIRPTLPGFYRKILDHITTHRWFMGIERKTAVPWSEAVADWYDRVYLPVTRAVRVHHLPSVFPGRSEADLYLWISEHYWFTYQQSGQKASYENAVVNYVTHSAGSVRGYLWRLIAGAYRLKPRFYVA